MPAPPSAPIPHPSHGFPSSAPPSTISPLLLKFHSSQRYPFINQIFEIELWLVNEMGKLQIRNEVPFTIKLGFEGEVDSSCDHLLEVVSGSRRIESNGKCLLKVKLLDLSASYGDNKFVFQATPLLDEHSYIRKGYSTPMSCIRHRLIVENRSQLPSLWFKDVGGKQNCIEIVVKLIDDQNKPVHRSIPLKLQLCYANGELVSRQNILDISKDSRLQINDIDGSTTLRVRITEVSMRHDGRNFSFCISPDTLKDPNSADVSPVNCSQVEVRSKVTIPKNKRGFEETLNPLPPSTPLLSPTAPSHAPPLSYLHHTTHQQQDELDSPSKKKRSVHFGEEIPTHPTALPSTAGLTGDLIQWTMSALETLNHIKWIETGREKIIERTSEGSVVEISRPVFTISNPNDLIEQLFSRYEHLSHLYPQLPSSASPPSPICSGSAEQDPTSCCTPQAPSPTFSFPNYTDAIDPSLFDNLPPLDAFPENSLTWGRANSFSTEAG
jgi:hypothetical protein